MTYTLYCGDCLDVLPTLPAASVDAVITDPPYGTTQCAWDSVIPLTPMWEQLKRIVTPTVAVVLFGAQPFTSALVMSNPQWFRYSWVWDKVAATGHLSCESRPLRQHEDILVFSSGVCRYNPQLEKGELLKVSANGAAGVYGSVKPTRYESEYRYPKSIIEFTSANGTREFGLHPTQKPLDLMRYLVRTYTNPSDTVLDFAMGSGTTGVACRMEGRNFIGIELDAKYYATAEWRIANAQPPLFVADAPPVPEPEQAAMFAGVAA